MQIDVRCLPQDKQIRSNPVLFASWLGSDVFRGYCMSIGEDCYLYSKHEEVIVRFYPGTGIITVPYDDRLNLDYLFAKLYEYAAPVDEEAEERHAYSNWLRCTKARDLCLFFVVLYVWMYASGNPWPVPARFWIATIAFIIVRIGLIYLLQFLEEGDYVGKKARQNNVK